ncbi:GH16335, partial [Drosophila grimshawi]
GEMRNPLKVCQHPHSTHTTTTCPPPTIYTQAPQFVRRSPSLMLSPSSCQASASGSGVRCSVSSTQLPHPHPHSHPPCTSASAATHLAASSKNVQCNLAASSISASTSLIPPNSDKPTTGNVVYYGGNKSVTSTTMTSSLIHRKKPLLTRSEVSSSEFFSVSFCLESSQLPDEEFIPATKGTTLLNALKKALQRRNLTFSQITITDNNPTYSYLDTGPSTMTILLDEYTDVENLAGHHLVISERDSSRKTLQKAASFGSRQRPHRLLSSASTEETSELGTGKQIKQRWTSIFSIKNPQQNQLYDLLNDFAKNGVPQRPEVLSSEHSTLSDPLSYLQNMDKSWRDFVDSVSMSDSEIKIQTAIWELVTTEVYYIHALQTVTDLFLACLEAVQEQRLLIDVDQHRLFSNVRSVCEANIKFWSLWLYPMVAHSIRTHEPLRCAFFQEGFITFASIFAPYKVYCAEQSTCQFYCKELNQNNALFTAYLAWCESQKMCNRLRLADIVVRPMQRLTKYSLLLAAIKKHMSDVKEIEVMDTMIHSVENFVGSVNNHLTMRQESERLKGVMARIESYDVVDTNNEMLDKLIKQHSQMFDLCAPMRGCPSYHVRHLFMEGDHKFKDNVGKSDVHCFLLTDILLVCKSIAKKGLGALKVIRQPYLTDHLIVHLAHNNILNCVYLNEFQVATTAFTLQCTEAKNWYDALWRAKTIYQRLKRGNGGDSFRFGGSGTSAGTGDSLGVRKSPINSSIGSHVSSANNSHSGSFEWNDSRNISIDFEKTNSLSSDEGSNLMVNQGQPSKGKQQIFRSVPKPQIGTIASTSANTLSVQPVNHLGQSLPNLNLQHSQTVPLRRGMAFSTSTKNPPLLKTRNITSQNSINWHQIPATPTPTSPRSQHNSPGNASSTCPTDPRQLQKQISHQMPLQTAQQSHLDLQRNLSNETDV